MSIEEIRARLATIENLRNSSASADPVKMLSESLDIYKEKVALYEAVLERVKAICADPGLAEEQLSPTIASLCGELAEEALRAREVAG